MRNPGWNAHPGWPYLQQGNSPQSLVLQHDQVDCASQPQQLHLNVGISALQVLSTAQLAVDLLWVLALDFHGASPGHVLPVVNLP